MRFIYEMLSTLKKSEYGSIFIFWVPLFATWLMMSVEGPFLAAVIARLVEPKYNLAAYGVAFSFALMVESPIIMIMSASTALVRGAESYRSLRAFTLLLNGLITAVMIVLILPPVFNFIALDLIGLPAEVARLTHLATMILLPWPAAIGFRRFFQGILIRNNQTRRVAYGTILRLASMASTAVIIYLHFDVPGAVVGATALSVAVSVEAIASWIMVRPVIRQLRAGERNERSEDDLSWGFMWKFYYPLALTSLLALGVHPLVTFFLGQSRMPLESLAIMPVINSLVFIFRSVGLSYQEVAIARMGEHMEGFRPVRNFAFALAGGAFTGLALIAFTPLSTGWFRDLSGLSAELSSLAIFPTRILVLIPAASVLLAFQRSVLVHIKRTGPVTVATAIEVSLIILVLILCIGFLGMIGATAAAISFVVGRAGANAWLMRPMLGAIRAKREGEVPAHEKIPTPAPGSLQ